MSMPSVQPGKRTSPVPRPELGNQRKIPLAAQPVKDLRLTVDEQEMISSIKKGNTNERF
jgi:hypothetical protein